MKFHSLQTNPINESDINESDINESDINDSDSLLEPGWSGARQRASLKGFARLKAVLWRRSLGLYEGWKLLGYEWYRPLRDALQSASRGLDLFSVERVHQQADVFGETPIITVVHLLQIAESLTGVKPTSFVDLGCGRGVTCLTAASLAIPALGFEREAAWVEAGRDVASNLSLGARFEESDFLRAEWPPDSLYLVVATAYPEPMRIAVLHRFAALEGTNLIWTADWELSSNDFQCLWAGTLPVGWGTARFALYRSLRMS